MPFPSHETIALARRLYAEGMTVARILAHTDMSLGTLYRCLDGEIDDDPQSRLPPIPRRRVVVGKRRRPLKGDRVSLVNRLWRTAERQVRDIEQRLAQDCQEPSERERDARVLAVLVKTLRDLAAFDAAAHSSGEKTEANDADDDPVPRDLDELRRELSRRLERIAADTATGTGREPQSG